MSLREGSIRTRIRVRRSVVMRCVSLLCFASVPVRLKLSFVHN
jgi:hypothetical protein